MDPRRSIIEERLARVARIIAVTGGKGGVGKSAVASTLALALARSGKRTGLFDLDLTSPTDHVFLGAGDLYPTEELGVEPPEHEGIRFMSLTWFSGESPAPLRGENVTNALLELLAITRWGKLDALVIDMPPGLGDTMLDAVRLLPRAEYLVVAGSSKMVRETVRRNLRLLAELGASIAGIVENMKRADSPVVLELAEEHGVPLLGALPWDDTLEEAIGDVSRLATTPFARAVDELRNALFP